MNDTQVSLWDSMLDIEMNEIYYGCLCRGYSRLELVLKIILALSTSMSFASWRIWFNTSQCNNSNIWQFLMGLSAVIAVAMPWLNLSRISQRSADLHGLYAALLVDYEWLWLQVDKLSEPDLLMQYRLLREKEVELVKLESDMPRYRRLILKCQNEVEKRRDLK